MKRDRVGSASDEELGRLLRGAIERGGEQGVALLVFSYNVQASLAVPVLYDDDCNSIPAETMHEFANVTEALLSLNHSPLRSVEVRREYYGITDDRDEGTSPAGRAAQRTIEAGLMAGARNAAASSTPRAPAADGESALDKLMAYRHG